MTRTYNKLVRDKIPEIIDSQGRKAVIRTLDDTEYLTELKKKLLEEAQEFFETEAVGELADVLEVVRALSHWLGVDSERLEEIRTDKFAQRGGFEGKILLVEVSPDSIA